MELRTERLVLRLPRPQDADAVAGYLGDPEVMRFLGGETVPRRDVPVVVGRWIDAWDRDGVGKFIVEHDGVVVGRVGINVWTADGWAISSFAEAGAAARPELGWTLAREHWGNGYATEAARAVRSWVYETRAWDRLISLIVPGNARSERVAGLLGAEPAETVTMRATGDRMVVWVHPR